MLDVNDVVADGEVAEVGDEGCGFGFARLDARGDVGIIGEIVGSEEDEVLFGDTDAGGDLRAHDNGDAHVSGEMAGFVVEVFAADVHGAAAETIGELIFAQDGRDALDFGLIGSGDEDALLLCNKIADLLDEGGDGAVEAQRRARWRTRFRRE